ncbi:MAG: hypothetical protein ACI376_05630 [Candidatus Bruticola sp.]
MTTTVSTALLLCAIALVIIGVTVPIVIIVHLHAIEENLEKTAILLTVLANLQGATDADVARAAGLEEEEESSPRSPKSSEGKKKGK